MCRSTFLGGSSISKKSLVTAFGSVIVKSKACGPSFPILYKFSEATTIINYGTRIFLKFVKLTISEFQYPSSAPMKEKFGVEKPTVYSSASNVVFLIDITRCSRGKNYL